MIGVIGGMGPLATADYFQKVIEETPAQGDPDHVPMMILSDPRIPSRPDAILANGTSPLPVLLALRDRLIAAGATALVMPCNTAHYWYQDLAANCPVPFLNIVEASVDAASRVCGAGDQIGIIATRATLAAKLYEPALERAGLRPLLPDDSDLDQFILPSIIHVKAGRLADSHALMVEAVQRLIQRGATSVILACTEAPIALAGAPPSLMSRSIDSTLALAKATVRHWRA